MNENKKLSVIVPCYNEEKNLDSFLQRILQTIKKLGLDYNIIFVDDGSSDKTWKKISSFSINNTKITSIRLTRNFGHQSALKVGLDNADGDYIFSLDADLQDPPELLIEMINKIKDEKLNIIYAQRNNNNESFIKKTSSYLFYFLFNKISKVKILQQVSDFRLIDSNVLKELKKIKEYDLFYRGLIPWMGFDYGVIKFDRDNRKQGKTGWSFVKMIDFALTGIFKFSNLPMRLSFLITFFMIVIFLLLSFYTFFVYFSGNVIKGWTSIIIVISFLNIGIFFILGIISEYVGRIYNEIKSRPNYIINEKIN